MRTAQFLSIALLSFSSFIAQAAEPFTFAGIRLSGSMSGEAEAELEEAGITFGEDIDSGALSIFAGYSNSNYNRWIVAYESRSFEFTESDVEEDATGLRIDWHFVWGEDKKVQPYLALGFGFYNLDEATVLTGTPMEGDGLSGVSFQFGAGAKVAIQENVELDLAFERQAISWEDIEIVSWGGSETLSTNYSNNSLSAALAIRF